MRLLLDTHIMLWCLEDSPRLTARARDLVTDPSNDVLVSAASLWEVAIKHALGRLQLDLATLEPGLRKTGFEQLDITGSHALAVAHLPEHHRDPFDRLLAAQSIAEGLRLVTHDSALLPTGRRSWFRRLPTLRVRDPYTFSEYRSMFGNAGFSQSALHPVPDTPQSVIVSTR